MTFDNLNNANDEIERLGKELSYAWAMMVETTAESEGLRNALRDTEYQRDAARARVHELEERQLLSSAINEAAIRLAEEMEKVIDAVGEWCETDRDDETACYSSNVCLEAAYDALLTYRKEHE